MNFYKKISFGYAKSLLQTSKIFFSSEDETLDFSLITNLESEKSSVTLRVLREELNLIRGFFLSSKSVADLYKNPTYSEKTKLETLLFAFPGLSSLLKNFLRVLSERNHLFLLPQVAEEFDDMLSKIENIIKIKLTVANSFPSNGKKFSKTLLATLKKITGAKDIILSFTYNPKILGGIIIEYNSVSIDASVLNDFKTF